MKCGEDWVYKIIFKESVEKDLKKINKKDIIKIKNKINNDLSKNPGKNKQLKGVFKGIYSYRMGNYRILYSILKDKILILQIGDRKNIYKK